MEYNHEKAVADGVNVDRNLPERYREGRAGDGRSPYFMGE
jgi:hypothetical protein